MRKMMLLLFTAIYLSPVIAVSSSSTEPSLQEAFKQSEDALWPIEQIKKTFKDLTALVIRDADTQSLLEKEQQKTLMMGQLNTIIATVTDLREQYSQTTRDQDATDNKEQKGQLQKKLDSLFKELNEQFKQYDIIRNNIKPWLQDKDTSHIPTKHIKETFTFLEKFQDDSPLGQHVSSFSAKFAETVQDRETLKLFNANRLLAVLQQFAEKIWTQRANQFLKFTEQNKESGRNYNLNKFTKPWSSIKPTIELIKNEKNLDMLLDHLETFFLNIHAFDEQLVAFKEALAAPRVVASSFRQRKFPSTKAPTPPTAKQVAGTQTRNFLPRPTRDAPKPPTAPPVITHPKPVLKAPVVPPKPADLTERVGLSVSSIQIRQLPPLPIARNKPAVQTRQLPPPPIARDEPTVQTRQLPPPPIARDEPTVQTRQLPPPPIARDEPAIKEKNIPERLRSIRRLTSKGRRPSNVRAALARGTTTYTEPTKKENKQPQQQPGRMGFGMIDLGSVQLKKRTQ